MLMFKMLTVSVMLSGVNRVLNILGPEKKIADRFGNRSVRPHTFEHLLV